MKLLEKLIQIFLDSDCMAASKHHLVLSPGLHLLLLVIQTNFHQSSFENNGWVQWNV